MGTFTGDPELSLLFDEVNRNSSKLTGYGEESLECLLYSKIY